MKLEEIRVNVKGDFYLKKRRWHYTNNTIAK